MVTKGLSWALRELTRRNAAAVRDFLTRHDDALTSSVRREVTNKLDTGLKGGLRKKA